MQQRWRKYYTKEKMPIGEEYTFEKEFEVWARIIRDSEGNDVHVFRKEDKKNKLRRDSSFYYYEGNWEVFEMKGETEITLKNSLGIESSSIRDSKGKLQERIVKDKDGNLIVNDKYIWDGDLLAKVISLDEVRTYHYGKNPYEDTVRVIPSDKIRYPFNSYDGSVGKVPRKDDEKYVYYLMDPYGIVPFDIETNPNFVDFAESSNYTSLSNIHVLKKSFPDLNNKISYPISMEYINTPFSDTSSAKCRASNNFCPPNFDKGNFHTEPKFKKVICACYADNYVISEYDVELVNSRITLQQSFLARRIVKGPNGELWERKCLTKREIQATYTHEVQHLFRTINKMKLLSSIHMPEDKFGNLNACRDAARNASQIISIEMNEWIENEKLHTNPGSPQNTGYTFGEDCDE
jgi:hypothetical protein